MSRVLSAVTVGAALFALADLSAAGASDDASRCASLASQMESREGREGVEPEHGPSQSMGDKRIARLREGRVAPTTGATEYTEALKLLGVTPK